MEMKHHLENFGSELAKEFSKNEIENFDMDIYLHGGATLEPISDSEPDKVSPKPKPPVKISLLKSTSSGEGVGKGKGKDFKLQQKSYGKFNLILICL